VLSPFDGDKVFCALSSHGSEGVTQNHSHVFVLAHGSTEVSLALMKVVGRVDDTTANLERVVVIVDEVASAMSLVLESSCVAWLADRWHLLALF
jgi:hypothetical protein